MKLQTQCLTFVVIAVAILWNLKEAEGRRRHWGRDMADAYTDSWDKLTKTLTGSSYKYWHYKRDRHGNWRKRKYGHSQSGSGSRSGSRSRSRSSSRSSSYERGRSHSASNNKKNEYEDSTMVAQAFVFYVDAYGCDNATGFQDFLASYNNEVKEDKLLAINSQHEILGEMSRLAQVDMQAAQGTKVQNNSEKKEPRATPENNDQAKYTTPGRKGRPSRDDSGTLGMAALSFLPTQ